MPCLPLLILNRMGGCKFTTGDMSVFAQHALYTFINFVLNGGCDLTPGGNQTWQKFFPTPGQQWGRGGNFSVGLSDLCASMRF